MSINIQVPVRCPNCAHEFDVESWTVVDADVEPHLHTALVRGELNVAHCSECEHRGALEAPMIYHDSQRRLVVCLVPDTVSAHADMDVIVAGLVRKMLDDFELTLPDEYMCNPRVVTTLPELISAVRGPEDDALLDTPNSLAEKVGQLLAATLTGEADQVIERYPELCDAETITTLHAAARDLQECGDFSTADYYLAAVDALMRHRDQVRSGEALLQ